MVAAVMVLSIMVGALLGYAMGYRAGVKHMGRLWGPFVVQSYKQLTGEDLDRRWWPTGTEDDADTALLSFAGNLDDMVKARKERN